MADSWGQRPFTALVVVLAAVVAASGHIAAHLGLDALGIVFAGLALMSAMGMLLFIRVSRPPLPSILPTACIVLFVGGALFNASFLRITPDGLDLIVLLIAATFATDTGAYVVGRMIGSRKLAPSVSPGKTWEGAAGGLLAAILAGAVFALVLGYGNQWIAVAALLGITGQIGDLYVSRLKRHAGLDDSGTIFPGHGGMLDRLDSLSFNLIVVGLAGVPLL